MVNGFVYSTIEQMNAWGPLILFITSVEGISNEFHSEEPKFIKSLFKDTFVDFV